MYISDAEHSKIGHQYSLSTRSTPKTVAPYCRSPLDQELGSPPYSQHSTSDILSGALSTWLAVGRVNRLRAESAHKYLLIDFPSSTAEDVTSPHCPRTTMLTPVTLTFDPMESGPEKIAKMMSLTGWRKTQFDKIMH